MTGKKRLLLANTNTSAAVTEKIVNEARLHAGPTIEITGANASFGPEIISNRTEMAISTHGLIDLCAAHAEAIDGLIVGMSLDAGVWAAREMLDVPVIGMSEAALSMASLHGNRIGMFVFGNATQPYREMALAYGYGQNLAAVQALGVTPQEHLADPSRVEARIIEMIQSLAEAGEIDCAILVGAVAAGLPRKLQDRLPVPALEGISCAVLLMEAMLKLNLPPAKAGSFSNLYGAPRPSKGLSPKLEGYFKQTR